MVDYDVLMTEVVVIVIRNGGFSQKNYGGKSGYGGEVSYFAGKSC